MIIYEAKFTFEMNFNAILKTREIIIKILYSFYKTFLLYIIEYLMSQLEN